MKLLRHKQNFSIIMAGTMIILLFSSMMAQFHHHDYIGNIHFGNHCCADLDNHGHDEDAECGMHLDVLYSDVIDFNQYFTLDYKHTADSVNSIDILCSIALDYLYGNCLFICLWDVLAGLRAKYSVIWAFRGPPVCL